MDQRSGAREKYTPWGRGMNASASLSVERAEWDQLLDRLGLTDAEALAAVRDGKEAGQSIRSFVRWAFREHFVPEEVLLAMSLQREAGQAQLPESL